MQKDDRVAVGVAVFCVMKTWTGRQPNGRELEVGAHFDARVFFLGGTSRTIFPPSRSVITYGAQSFPRVAPLGTSFPRS